MPYVACKGKTQLYHKYKWRAKQKKLAWKLTLEEFCKLVSQRCHYCGKAPGARYVSGGGLKKFKTLAVGVDRKSSKRGYTTGNALPCCWHCNDMKGDMGYQQFLKAVRDVFLYRVRGGRHG